VVNVSSGAHLFGNFNVSNPNLKGEYNNWKAYGQSKLANVMFTFELAKRLPAQARVDSNASHPGAVSTELARCASLVPRLWQQAEQCLVCRCLQRAL
jgi:NAD(P)-dependent dehydrogenase (short-subunit alcohol dehydrogenase family)